MSGLQNLIGISLGIKLFLVYSRYKYILKSTEQTVYVLVYDQKWTFLTGMQLVYGILVYV